MDQIMEYMTSNWIVGILAVSVIAAAAAMGLAWMFAQFFEVLEGDE